MHLKSLTQTLHAFSHPLQFYALYFNLIHPSTTQISLRNGLRFRIRPPQGDHFVLGETFLNRSYHYPLSFLNPDTSIIIDIGAYIGDFTLLASLRARHVYAYEPDPRNFRLLKHNLTLNSRQNVTPFQLALTDRASRQPLYTTTDHPHSHSLYSSLIKPSLRQPPLAVTCSTLPDQIAAHHLTHVDLLKLDCEGAEFPILMSLPNSTFKIIRRLILEYHDHASPQYSHHQLASHLQHHGFQTRILSTLNPTTGILYAQNKNFNPQH